MPATLKKAAAALRDADVPFALGGGFAAWAHGSPSRDHDVDFLVKEGDVERALEALASCGMRTDRPPEGGLVKAFDGDVVVDVIHSPAGTEVGETLSGRAEELSVDGMPMPVVHPDDLLTSTLPALTERSLEFAGLLVVSRALREQVDITPE